MRFIPAFNVPKIIKFSQPYAAVLMAGFSLSANVSAQEAPEKQLASDICIRSSPTGACLSPEAQLDYAARPGDVVTFGVRAVPPPPGVQISAVSHTWLVGSALQCESGTGGPADDHCTIKLPASAATDYTISLKMAGTVTRNGVATKIRKKEVGNHRLFVVPDTETFGAANSFSFCDTDAEAVVRVIEPANLNPGATSPHPAVVFFRGTGGGEKDIISTASSNGYYVFDVEYTRLSSRVDNKLLPFNQGACAVRWARAHAAWDENGNRIANPRPVRKTGKSLQIHPGRIFTAGFSQGGGIASHLGIVNRTNGVPVVWNEGLNAAIDAAVSKPAWTAIDGIENTAVNSTWRSYSSDVQGAAVVSSASEWSTFLSLCLFPAAAMAPDLERFNHEVAFYYSGFGVDPNVLQKKHCYDASLPAADRTLISAFLWFGGTGGWGYDLGDEGSENHRVWSALSWLPLAKNNGYAPPTLTVNGTADALVPVVESLIESRYLRAIGRMVKSIVTTGGHTKPFEGGSPIVVTQFFDAISHGLDNNFDVATPAGFEAAFRDLNAGRSSSSVLCPDTRRPDHGFYCDEEWQPQ